GDPPAAREQPAHGGRDRGQVQPLATDHLAPPLGAQGGGPGARPPAGAERDLPAERGRPLDLDAGLLRPVPELPGSSALGPPPPGRARGAPGPAGARPEAAPLPPPPAPDLSFPSRPEGSLRLPLPAV